jgi:hypothetical protein
MSKKSAKKRFGHLPPEYRFSLNPYPEMRFSSCPDCGAKTGQRKLPLLIHIYPEYLIALNYTNRYCNRCNMLIGHKHEIEYHLTELFKRNNPEIVGNNYLIIGTVEKKIWRENIRTPKPLQEILDFSSDFKSYGEIRMTMGGWFKEGVTPPVMEPPKSKDWVKS